MHRTIAIGYEKSSLLEALLWDMQHAVLCSCWLLGESLGYITVSYFNLLVSRTGVGELIPAVSICQVSPDPRHLLGNLEVAVFFGHHLEWKNYFMNLHPSFKKVFQPWSLSCEVILSTWILGMTPEVSRGCSWPWLPLRAAPFGVVLTQGSSAGSRNWACGSICSTEQTQITAGRERNQTTLMWAHLQSCGYPRPPLPRFQLGFFTQSLYFPLCHRLCSGAVSSTQVSRHPLQPSLLTWSSPSSSSLWALQLPDTTGAVQGIGVWLQPVHTCTELHSEPWGVNRAAQLADSWN